jgi:type II secretory pathway pseudopilin PulG
MRVTSAKWRVTSGKSGFTMIEIAIAIGVIGFALVAIIGILPMGLNVQKDNREDTIVSQDGQYFMDVLRYSRQGVTQDQGKALDFLTNYVESVTIRKVCPSTDVSKTFTFTQNNMTNGQTILDLLSTPRFQPAPFPNEMFTNTVTAIVRGMSGSALEQNGGNSLVAFKYQMEVQLMPYCTSPLMIDVYTNYLLGVTNQMAETNSVVSEQELQYLQNNLLELRLAYSWPVLPNNKVGPNQRYFRTTISGRLHRANYEIDPAAPNTVFHLYYIDPGTYTNLTATSTNVVFD